MTERLTDEVVRVLTVHRAPRDLVFAALTTPEHLTHFWGPVGTHTPPGLIVVDLRPGGAFETTMINDLDGSSHTMRAVYLEVDEPGFLSWQETDSGMITELTLTDRGDGNTYVLTVQRGLPPAYRTPTARAGWQTALERGAAYTATLATPNRKANP